MSLVPNKYLVQNTAGTYISSIFTNGTPSASYIDGSGNLVFARNASADGSGGWTITTVLSNVGNVIVYTSLQIVNSVPCIAFQNTTGGVTGLYFVSATNNTGTAWNIPVIVTSVAGQVKGGYPSLYVVNGNPAIAYQNLTTSTIEYTYASNTSGSSWSNTPIVISTQIGININLQVYNSFPAVSFYDNIDVELFYLTSNTSNGLPTASIQPTWNPLITLDNDNAGAYVTMTSLNNQPIITYFEVATQFNSVQQLKVIVGRAKTFLGNNFPANSSYINIVSTGVAFGPTSIINIVGLPIIAYQNSNGNTLNVAYTSDPNGFNNWFSQVFDSSAVVATYLSACTIGNLLGIFYNDVTNGKIDYINSIIPFSSMTSLQNAYNSSSQPEIILSAAVGSLTIQDNAAPLVGNLFQIQNNGGSTTYFEVSSVGATVNGKLTVTGLIDPTGLVLYNQPSVPGGNPAVGDTTLWIDNASHLNLTTSGGITTTILPSSGSVLLVTAGVGLTLDYTSGTVAINGTIYNISASSIVVGANLTNNVIYVSTSGIISVGASYPPNSVPLATFSTNGATVTSVTDNRTFLENNIIFGSAGDISNVAATNVANAGTTNKYAMADHVHTISTGPPSTQTPDQVNATGVSANLARADHIHTIATAAPITNLSVSSTNAQGSAITFSRSDHSHFIDITGFSLNNLLGPLNVSNGGTGQTSLLANNFVIGNGTSPVLTSKAVPAGVVVGTTDNQALTNKTITDPTNNVYANALNSVTTSVIVNGSAAPTAGQVLIATSGTAASWQTIGSSSITINPPVNPTDGNGIQFSAGILNLEYASATQPGIISTGTQTIAGNKTFSGTTNFSSLAASSVLYLNASNNLSSFALTNGQVLVGSTGANPVATTITGTANQVIVTNGSGSITLSTPQNINVGASPTFVSMTLTSASNQLTLGTTNTLILNSSQSTTQTLTIPNITTSDTLSTLKLSQTFSGNNTFTGNNIIYTNTTIVDSSVITKVLAFNLSGMIVNKTLTLASVQTSSQTLTIPNITTSDTISTLGLSQTFTGANTFTLAISITAASNQISFGSTNVLTLNSSQTTSQTLTIPNITASDTIATLKLSQTFTGTNSFSNNIFANGNPGITSTGNLILQAAAGNNIYFNDGTDSTKQIRFNLTGQTSGTILTISSVQSTTQTITIPNITASDTIATLKLSQTFTGTNSFSSALVANGNPGITSTGNLILQAAAGNNIYFNDGADATKQIRFNLTGQTSGTILTISSVQSTTQTITIPNITASDTIATLKLSQTFTGTNSFSSALVANGNPGITSTGNLILQAAAGNNIYFNDGADATKQIRFNLTGQTSGTILAISSVQSTTQTLTIPNITGADTLVTLNVDNTFTGTNIFKDGSKFQIQNSSDATKILEFNTGSNTTGKTLTISTNQTTSQTLNVPNITGTDTLPTLAISNIFTGANTFKDGTSFAIVSSSDSTKELEFNVSSNTTGKVLTISTSQTNSETLNIPNITGSDTLDTLKLSQTFTGNKFFF